MVKSNRNNKIVDIDKFLRVRELVQDDVLSIMEASRALGISVYMYRKWDEKCKDITSSDIR